MTPLLILALLLAARAPADDDSAADAVDPLSWDDSLLSLA